MESIYLKIALLALEAAAEAASAGALAIEELEKERAKHTLIARPLIFGKPVKKGKEPIPMRIEADEKAPVELPVITDDDGDPVEITSATFAVADPNIATFVADEGGDFKKGWLVATGAMGATEVTATVQTAAGEGATFRGVLEVGPQVPVDGELMIGIGVKK